MFQCGNVAISGVYINACMAAWSVVLLGAADVQHQLDEVTQNINTVNGFIPP